MKNELLRKLPKIDELAQDASLKEYAERLPREKFLEILREVVTDRRERILASESAAASAGGGKSAAENLSDRASILAEAEKKLSHSELPSLRPVINATGVALHTNLGRARLSESAVDAVISVAGRYCTLEYDCESGGRGSRHSHVEKKICAALGCEASMVVNNNAAATLLVLAALCRGREVVISRGELVEIGGSFRIPEIMEESGAILREIGTTNKTRLSDYEKNVNENTAALLKVHTSNYRIVGFTEEVGARELSALAAEKGLPFIYDLGSGLLADLSDRGIFEPTAGSALRDGADLVLFSGDKLLGGPQGGVIAGRKALVELCKAHPLARAFRVDKLTLAAMEATFDEYYDTEAAKKNIPVLAMLCRSAEELREAAADLKSQIDDARLGFNVEIAEEEGPVGGGSAPQSKLVNAVLRLWREDITAERLERALRAAEPPVVARIRQDRLTLDLRTLESAEFPDIVRALGEAVGKP